MAAFPTIVLVICCGARQMQTGNVIWKIIYIRDSKTIKTRDMSGRERVCPGQFQLLMVHRTVLTGGS